MTEDKHKNNDHSQQTPDAEDVHIPVEEMDAASHSLAEALGVSFNILKVIMAIVIVAFLASGFKTIGSDEQALVLRFGKLCKINDDGDNPYVRGAGLMWTFPYPIDEVFRIRVNEKVTFETRSFWYFDPDDKFTKGPTGASTPPAKLNPVTEGYSLVRGQGLDSDGSDYNLVHSKWQVVYEISDIARFFRNVQVA
ncbi:MAG: hypothetical protein MI922_21685, partial [Bacteroidales bacterium]|nr:hypothetical protein [Bacteroidales bacterium]